MNDCDVRTLYHCVSVDCLLMRSRLRYLRRLVLYVPPPLLAALHLRVNDRVLPWVSLVVSDMQHLKNVNSLAIPDPEIVSDVWITLIRNQPAEWNEMVHKIIFFHSVSDRGKASGSQTSIAVIPSSHVCNICQQLFPTSKALGGHLRMVHKIRSRIRLFVPSAVCPVCKSVFSCRISCILHLSDSRRPKCRELLLSGDYPELPPGEVIQLDEIDRVQKRLAKRAGHSHVLSTAPCVTASGRLRGVASRSTALM